MYNLLYLCGLMGNSPSNSDDEDDKEPREVMNILDFIEICDERKLLLLKHKATSSLEDLAS